MEPTTYFTLLVLGIGAIHLVCQAFDKIGTWKGKTQQIYGKRTQSRDDWYVFFHRSDLTGPAKRRNKSESIADRPSAASTTRRKSARRPVARVKLS
jgi:hypothetical protein